MHWFEKVEINARAGIFGVLLGGIVAVFSYFLILVLMPLDKSLLFLAFFAAAILGGTIAVSTVRKIVNRDIENYSKKKIGE